MIRNLWSNRNRYYEVARSIKIDIYYLIKKINENLKKIYKVKEMVAIDESIAPFKG
jgi:hypothetical protein